MSQEVRNISRYQVLSILGQGAMGRVFLAQDPLLKRKVAIKVVQERGQEAAHLATERFQREAEISARLNHPNIITVYDVGVDDRVGPFLAMEYVEGANFARVIRERQVDQEAMLKLLVQGAQALHAAGAAGIVHRDVKPENMLVSQDGRLKLMDFGIANQADQSRLTSLGAVVGTPSYTAPELLMGGEPSAATDRYAFAITAFECFTGQVPFAGGTVGATLLKIVHEPPVIPPEFGPEFGKVFEMALAKDPAARYPDLFTLLNALIEASPVSAAAKAKLQAALEGEGTLSGIGSGPMALPGLAGTDPGTSLESPVSASTGSQATRALRVPSAPPFTSRKELWIGLALFLIAGSGAGAWAYQKQQRQKPRLLKAETDPPGAEVIVDGVPLADRTPVAKEIPAAARTLEFRLKGHHPLKVEIPEGPLNLRPFTLEPLPPTLTLATHPPGVKVSIEGEALGLTPLEGKLIPPRLLKGKGPRPKLILRLEKEGFVPQFQSYEPGKDPGAITLQAEVPAKGR